MGYILGPADNNKGVSILSRGHEPPVMNSLWQPEDSNSKVAGNEDELSVEDNTDIISSILRKEIEGKVIISKIKTPSSLAEEKESFRETFLVAQEVLMSGTSLVSL